MTDGDIDQIAPKFLSAYANIPEPERVQVIAIVDEKPYSWDSAYNEIIAKTVLGRKILEKIRRVGII